MEYNLSNLMCSTFDKILSNGDTSILGIENHAEQWEKLNDEFIDTFGISKEYALYLKKMGQYVVYLNKSINGGDKSMINFANVYKAEAQDLIKTIGVGVNKYAFVSQQMGFRINPNEISVLEFYGYIKYLENNGKEN